MHRICEWCEAVVECFVRHVDAVVILEGATQVRERLHAATRQRRYHREKQPMRRDRPQPDGLPMSRPSSLTPSTESARARASRTLVSSEGDIAASFAGECCNPSMKLLMSLSIPAPARTGCLRSYL